MISMRDAIAHPKIAIDQSLVAIVSAREAIAFLDRLSTRTLTDSAREQQRIIGLRRSIGGMGPLLASVIDLVSDLRCATETISCCRSTPLSQLFLISALQNARRDAALDGA